MPQGTGYGDGLLHANNLVVPMLKASDKDDCSLQHGCGVSSTRMTTISVTDPCNSQRCRQATHIVEFGITQVLGTSRNYRNTQQGSANILRAIMTCYSGLATAKGWCVMRMQSHDLGSMLHAEARLTPGAGQDGLKVA